MRTILIVATLLLSACPGAPYDPCESVSDWARGSRAGVSGGGSGGEAQRL